MGFPSGHATAAAASSRPVLPGGDGHAVARRLRAGRRRPDDRTGRAGARVLRATGRPNARRIALGLTIASIAAMLAEREE